MDAGIPTAAPATGPTPGVQPAGPVGALNGAQGHGPASGFQAVIAAFFGHQGQDAGAGQGDAAASTGKVAVALKSDSKAGQKTMDDALNPTPDSGEPTTDKTAATPDNAAAATVLSPDALALAALFAAPLQKAPPVDETTAKPPATQASAPQAFAAQASATQASATQASAAKDAGLFAAAETPTVDLAAAAADADAAKADAAATGQATAANGRAKLMEFAEALAATRHGARAATIKADATQPGYRPPPAPTAADAATKPAPVPAADLTETVVANPAAEAQVAAAELPAPAPLPGKDRDTQRANRMDTVIKDAAGQPLVTPTAVDPAGKPVAAVTTALALQAGHANTVDDKPAKPEAAPPKVEASNDAGPAQAPAATTHTAPAAAQSATTATHGAPETVASLAAQIIKKADGRATRFDVELHPADLGRVNVRLEIGAHGRMTASMSFENPHAAAELRGRADELRNALESAGFDISGGMSFDVAGDSGQGRNQADQQSPDGGGVLRGRAFEAAVAAAGETANAALAGAMSAYQSRVAPGLDIRI